MTPYWQSEDGLIQVYCAPWEDVYKTGLIPVHEIKLIHADPPYGQHENTQRRQKKRGSATGKGLHPARDFPLIIGDDQPFDPSSLLTLQKPTVLWGAQRYANQLPISPSWIWWDKRENTGSDDNGDGELAWTNLGGPPRQFHHLWRGLCRASEKTGSSVHLHPTQKPIALSTYVFQRAKLKRGDLVFVPYGGSGPDLPAARAMGLRVIWCEMVLEYCDTAISRLKVITPEQAAKPVGPLFSR